MKALEAQKYQEAVEHFSRACQADPTDYAARFHLALARSMLGQDAEAIAEYRKVLEIKPGLYEAEVNLGILLLRQKRPAEAVSHLRAAVEQKPTQARPRLYLGQALLETGDLEGAEKNFRAALEADGGAAAHLGLARALLRQNRLEEAATHFHKAATLEAAFQDGLWELAATYEKAGRSTEAIAIYQQFPENAAARERLGHLLIEAGRPQEAAPHLEWVVERSPTVAARAALARAYLRSGQPEKALEQLRQALLSEPDNWDLRMMYGRALRDQKRYAEAAGEFLRVTQALPESLEAWNELAAMLISLERFQQALAALDRVRQLGGETAGHHYLRAIVLDRMKDYKNALAAYQAFLAADRGAHPEEEFKARHRIRVIEKELRRR